MRRSNETLRLVVTTYIGVVLGFFLGASFPTLSLNKKTNLQSTVPLSINIHDIEDKYPGLSTQTALNVWSSLQRNEIISSRLPNGTKVKQIWAPTNPRGAERLPPRLIAPESDLYLRRLWGTPSEDLTMKPRYLVTFAVGYEQKDNIDKAMKKFSENFTLMLFHYDGRTSEWNEFEWSKRAIHVSAPKQSKWWYAKRFLHPDIVAPYDYIFIWDEDLGLDYFDAEKYMELMKRHGLEISQPALLEKSGQLSWQMTRKRNDTEVHKLAKEREGWCSNPHLPPCAAFVEIMAPVFSRNAWRCVWNMIQNDLVHGWGLDFALRRCVQPAHEKIGVVDAQPIVHQTLPSLGNQGIAAKGKAPRVAVRERCKKEWMMFQIRMTLAERAYHKIKAMAFNQTNSTDQ
uniref:uncharacterized protein LOC122604762 n=1 Tax=Erigeron canadensis TaxID=72917 RepID=UPI001CB8DE70|nr:uncharacterized protein LOC122604762 [Erigeron canadensis]